MSRMDNKVVVVTAAAAGIGRACAAAFAREGAIVHAVDIDNSGLKKLASEIPCSITPHNLNLLDDAAIQSFAKKIEQVDVLFNCAGFVHHGALLDCTGDELDAAYQLNVRAAFLLTQALLPGMLACKSGNIINVASVAGVSIAAPNRCAYSATKAAMVGMTKSIACDYVGEGIRCNAICPGTVDTPSLQQRLNAFDDPVAARAEFEARQAMGRFARVDEIAALAIYLASDESGFTTGQAHIIDGGWSNGS